jgi:hypothetical protein
MIHYHGTPFTGDQQTAIQALSRRHGLVSYAHPKQIEIVAEVCQSFILDNGAYTTWKQGKEFDIDGYADWVSDWYRHPGCDFYFIPDSIEGGEQENRVMRAAWQQVCPDGAWSMGVPVWHLHESLEDLQYLCAAYNRIALGSSGQYSTTGTAQWWQRINEAMGILCDEQGRPKVKIHLLRGLDAGIFSHLPLSSADSCSVGRNAGIDKKWKGTYAPKSKATRAIIMIERIELHASASRWDGDTCGVQQNLGLFG